MTPILNATKRVSRRYHGVRNVFFDKPFRFYFAPDGGLTLRRGLPPVTDVGFVNVPV